MTEGEKDALVAWLSTYDSYYRAGELYNARVRFIKDQEKLGNVGHFNAHGEYVILNEAKRATYKANETLYEKLKGYPR